MGRIDLVIQDIIANPEWWAIRSILIIIAIALHEFGHAIMAVSCGDPTPKVDGRVTLNPIAHLDPIGTIGMLFMGFGWGKPVMVQPGNFRSRWDDVKVSAAGPAMNLLQALIFGIAMRSIIQLQVDAPVAYQIFREGVFINVGLMVFNMIPVGPLDGATVLKGFLPLRTAYEFHQFNSQWGMVVMLVLIFSGSVRFFIQPVRELALTAIHWGVV